MHLTNIKFIKEYLNRETTAILVNSLVLTRMDYCNSLLIGTPQSGLHKLQMVLHRAERIVCGVMFREHITELLITLHWLQVVARIKFKICLVTHKTLKYGRPEYLLKFLVSSETDSVMETRHDSDKHHLETQRTSLVQAKRAFSYVAPRFYNELPTAIKEVPSIHRFKKLLKSHFFLDCYDTQNKSLNPEYTV